MMAGGGSPEPSESAGFAAPAILSRASSSNRFNCALSTGGTGRSPDRSTILPASWPLYFAKSASVFASKYTTSLVTAPFVDGDHAFGYAITGMNCGSTTVAVNFLSAQPRPNGPH